MSTFSLRLPDDLREAAVRQAEAAGISLNQFIALAVAGHVAARDEAERYFKSRARRSRPAMARAVLDCAGLDNEPRPDDTIPD